MRKTKKLIGIGSAILIIFIIVVSVATASGPGDSNFWDPDVGENLTMIYYDDVYIHANNGQACNCGACPGTW